MMISVTQKALLIMTAAVGIIAMISGPLHIEWFVP